MPSCEWRLASGITKNDNLAMCGFTDPLEMPAPMLAKPLHHYRDRSEAPDWLREADRKLSEADAVVVVSAEYNHSIPPALSSLLGHFPSSSFSYKPSGIVCYSMGESPSHSIGYCRTVVLHFNVNYYYYYYYYYY